MKIWNNQQIDQNLKNLQDQDNFINDLMNIDIDIFNSNDIISTSNVDLNEVTDHIFNMTDHITWISSSLNSNNEMIKLIYDFFC